VTPATTNAADLLPDTPAAKLAVLLDVDGTLAPIVREAADASVPVGVRLTLVDLARLCPLVACVSGRTAEDARRVVGVAAITYIGGHGSELLEPGMAAVETDPQLGIWEEPVNRIAIEAMRELSPLGVRREEKGPIAALHWRNANDEALALEGLRRYSERALEHGLVVHWGRKVMEIRPPVPFDKGRGIERLLESRIEQGTELGAALYIGDDTTDLDAFAALDRLRSAGVVGQCRKVAVSSPEAPSALLEAADAIADGTEGVATMLAALLAEAAD